MKKINLLISKFPPEIIFRINIQNEFFFKLGTLTFEVPNTCTCFKIGEENNFLKDMQF